MLRLHLVGQISQLQLTCPFSLAAGVITQEDSGDASSLALLAFPESRDSLTSHYKVQTPVCLAHLKISGVLCFSPHEEYLESREQGQLPLALGCPSLLFHLPR